MHLLLPDAPEIVQPRWTLGVAAQCRPLQGTSPEAGAFMVCPAAPSRSVFRLGEPWLREGGGLSIAAASTYFPTASTSSSKLSPIPLMRRMACATGGPVTTSTRPHSFTPPCWVSSNSNRPQGVGRSPGRVSLLARRSWSVWSGSPVACTPPSRRGSRSSGMGSGAIR